MPNQYGVYFAKNGEVLRIPVNPEQYSIELSGDNSEYNVLQIGQIMVPRIPKLKVISWEGLLPGKAEGGYVLTSGGFLAPEYYINFFESCMADREPVQFLANRYFENGQAIFDTNLDVLVTSFSYEERGGETGDFYYSIELTEYRDYSPQLVDIQIIQDRPVMTAEEQRSIPAGEITVGCTVIANGQYWASSYGEPPSGQCSNYRAKVSRIIATDPSRPYPIHITTESGGWLGWLKQSQVQVVGE